MGGSERFWERFSSFFMNLAVDYYLGEVEVGHYRPSFGCTGRIAAGTRAYGTRLDIRLPPA